MTDPPWRPHVQNMPVLCTAESSFLLIRGVTSRDIQPPLTIAEYVDRCSTYFDASSFRRIPEGEDNIRRTHEGVMNRWGAWMKHLIHWFAVPVNLTTTDWCHLHWTRTPIEQEYQERMEPYVSRIYQGELRFYDHSDVNMPPPYM